MVDDARRSTLARVTTYDNAEQQHDHGDDDGGRGVPQVPEMQPTSDAAVRCASIHVYGSVCY